MCRGTTPRTRVAHAEHAREADGVAVEVAAAQEHAVVLDVSSENLRLQGEGGSFFNYLVPT